MNILVTGASGFLGQHLVERLVQGGHRVRALARTRPAGGAEGAVEWFTADLHDKDALRKALAGVEVLYHLAGRVSFDPKDGPALHALHVQGTRELLAEAKEARVGRVVLASTSGTIAVSKEERVATEADDYPIAVVGRWPYYLSKIYEEKLALEYCRRHGIPLVVLNPSLLMGPGDARLSSTWTVLKFLNREIPGMPSGGLSFVDVRDAADAFAAALTRGEVYGRHLLGLNMSFREFFGRLERLSGVSAPRLKLPPRINIWGARLLEKWAEQRGTEADLDSVSVEIAEHFFYLDSQKAERELGFKARDPHQTLQDTVADVLTRLPPEALPGTRGRLSAARSSAKV